MRLTTVSQGTSVWKDQPDFRQSGLERIEDMRYSHSILQLMVNCVVTPACENGFETVDVFSSPYLIHVHLPPNETILPSVCEFANGLQGIPMKRPLSM